MNKTSLVSAEMRLKYLNRRMDELSQSEQKLQDRDFDYFKNMGHQIKGNAVTFEFPVLTDYGVSLEDFAAAKNLTETKRVVGGLKLQVEGLLAEFVETAEKQQT